MTPVLAFLVLQFTLCLTIRVPLEWNNNSEVQKHQLKEQNELPIQTSAAHDVQKRLQKPIPKEYFEYTAKKPQFAVDIAASHGVKSPGNHYKAYPIWPYTGVKQPMLGQHNILDKKNHMYAPYRQFVNKNEHLSYVTPASTKYNIFHPYKAEEPALKAIYQDPVLDKIRNDLKDSKNRLQKYENNAGEPNIENNQYLENPEQTDRKKLPQSNIPTQFEIHRPQRRPVYYIPPVTHNYRDHILNKKIRHPWNQNYVKVTPAHYRPIKSHLQRLRQQHAMKYDDEHNEYPQIQPFHIHENKPDGYDIYEKGKENFFHLRNNVDASINKAVKENRPSVNQHLELQNKNNENEHFEDDNEFSPVKNYAQVRKIETVKHLPRDAAFREAETYDEIRNAPRLREAIKSTKAQTVYSEEGYEDTAYDHAGEQKHASDHEGHAGYLKEKEFSKGKYKIPTFTGNYEDVKGSSSRDNVIHGEKWKNNDKDNEEQKDLDEYSENDNAYVIEKDAHNDASQQPTNENVNIDYTPKINHLQNAELQHDLSKREANFQVPEINFKSTYLNKDEIRNISPIKYHPHESNDLLTKYPYYKQNAKIINKHSPLRYAENLKNIPRKSKGGTEFYDSRTQYECPEVEDDVDPLPEKLKKDGHPDENDDIEDQNLKPNNNFNKMDEQPRLNGLGDKIDCFKNKYFGENPLDSPFFKEEFISNPEPITPPISNIFKLPDEQDNHHTLKSQANRSISKNLNDNFNFLRNNATNISTTVDIDLSNVKANNTFQQNTLLNIFNNRGFKITNKNDHIENKMNEGQLFLARKKRATPFIYEPYKIIRDSQIQDSKKTTTTSNISPLIKQLQSSRVVDRVATNLNKDQPVKRNTGSLNYKNISRKDREKAHDIFEHDTSNSTFIDVNEGSRQTEPRFEQRPPNHKSFYTPIENKKSMSSEAYKNHTNINTEKPANKAIRTTRGNENEKLIGGRQFFDVSKYLPESLDVQKSDSSNRVKKIEEFLDHKSDSVKRRDGSSESQESKESDEDYEEYDDEEEEEEIIPPTTSTTTTFKPILKRRIRILTTTSRPQNEKIISTELPKLRLVTRFRDPVKNNLNQEEISTQISKKMKGNNDAVIPNYREKKKKSSKSTLVTDTKSYDEGNDDMRKEDVDALIGIKHDMEEYAPVYEKETESNKKKLGRSNSSEDKSSRNEDFEIDDDTDDVDDDDDSDDDNDDDDDDDIDTEDSDESVEEDGKITTPEPTKRTLPKTTDAPEMTTVARKLKSELKPIISKKKIEIHKELPANNNLTQFKQDIKEIEIIKEIPRKTSDQSAEILQLFKDENLAKEVNKIFDVEVFEDNIDLKNGPRHGGNYKSIKTVEKDGSSVPEQKLKTGSLNVSKSDSLSSESETSELTKPRPASKRQRENLRIRNTTQRSRRSRRPSTKLEGPPNSSVTAMHGGNLKLNQRQNEETKTQKSAKLIELSEDDGEDDNDSGTEKMHGGNFKSYSNSRNSGNDMHGGNYRSAKITQTTERNKENSRKANDSKDYISKNVRRNSAALLDSFARAVPILTTTPPYILDPSKRMYYYVDS